MNSLLKMEQMIKEHTQKAVRLHALLKKHSNERIRKMIDTDTPTVYAFRVGFENPIQYSHMDYDVENNEEISEVSISYPLDAGVI